MTDVTNEIINAADKIAAIVKESETYKNYISARVEIMKQPELVERLKEFKRQNNEYLRFISQGGEDFNREKYLSQEYYKLRLYDEVAQFLDCEKSLVSSLAKLYGTIFENRLVEFLV